MSNRRTPPSTADIQAAADELNKKWTAAVPTREAIAREAAEIDDNLKVDAAIRFHKETGMYPWQMPQDAIPLEQRQWLSAAGINLEDMRQAAREEMERLIAARSSQNPMKGR